MLTLLCAIGVVCAYAVGSLPLSSLANKSVEKLVPLGGPKVAALVKVLSDIAKGTVAVTLFCAIVGREYAQFGALFAYAGHVYPFCPKCRGGNGIGLLLGAMIAVDPVVGLIALMAWLFTYYVYRYASLAALAATFMTPIIANMVDLEVSVYVLYAIALMVIVRQKDELLQLLEGDERMVAWDGR